MINFFFKFFLVFSGFFVIFSRNPVHSVLFLILVFCNGAGILFLSGADFLALIFLVVYVGAVSILFLFIVMMLNLKMIGFRQSLFNHYPVAMFIFVLFLLEFKLFFKYLFNFSSFVEFMGGDGWLVSFNHLSSIYVFGSVCYTFYFVYFLVCALILVVSMVGPIFLTLFHSHSSKESSIYLSKLPVVRYFQ